MLHLASTTDPAWTRRALAGLDAVLIDHAHLERKAASNAITLMFRYTEHPGFMRPLSELAREELEHFELMLGVLARRGLSFGPQVPSPYAARLREAVRSGEPERCVDLLLCSALIEARSCERMLLLAEAAPDPELASLYRGLLASEARHHTLFVELATQVQPEAAVDRRLAELATHEAAVIARAPAEPRFHN